MKKYKMIITDYEDVDVRKLYEVVDSNNEGWILSEGQSFEFSKSKKMIRIIDNGIVVKSFRSKCCVFLESEEEEK